MQSLNPCNSKTVSLYFFSTTCVIHVVIRNDKCLNYSTETFKFFCHLFTKIFSYTHISRKLANIVISAVLRLTVLEKYYRPVAIVNIIGNYKCQRENTESLKSVDVKLASVWYVEKV